MKTENLESLRERIALKLLEDPQLSYAEVAKAADNAARVLLIVWSQLDAKRNSAPTYRRAPEDRAAKLLTCGTFGY
jgi:hypothetical protein